MRTRNLVAAAFVVSLVLATPGFARHKTTNAPPIMTIKVTITDNSIAVRPKSAVRGTNTIFILTNRGTKTQRWLLGAVARGRGKKIGFASILGPNQQKTVVMFLDYRGLLPYSASATSGGKTLKGSFRIH